MVNPLGSQALYKGVQQEVVTKLPLGKNYNDNDNEATFMYQLLHLPSMLTLCDSSNCSYLTHL